MNRYGDNSSTEHTGNLNKMGDRGVCRIVVNALRDHACSCFFVENDGVCIDASCIEVAEQGFRAIVTLACSSSNQAMLGSINACDVVVHTLALHGIIPGQKGNHVSIDIGNTFNVTYWNKMEMCGGHGVVAVV